jgi:hypothetical protein
MARHQELMERLAAADPLRDGEQMTPEDQREANALLERLLATPVDAKTHRPRLRRRALAVAGVACAAVAGPAAIDLLDADTPGSGVIDKAVAAVTRQGFVYHVVEFTTASASPPLEDGASAPPVLAESWYTSDGRLHRKAFVVRDGKKGRLAEDYAGWQHAGRRAGAALRFDGFTNTITESGWARNPGGAPTIDSAQAPGGQLRALVEDGRLRVAGTTSVDGKRAYRLVSGKIDMDGAELEIEFTVDASSYLPLSQHITTRQDGGQTYDVETRYRTYEQLPLNARTDRLLALDPHPDAKCSEYAHELTEERDLGFPNPCR